MLPLLLGCVGGNPAENAGGHGAPDGGVMFFGKRRAKDVYGDKFTLWDLPHEFIDLDGGENNYGAGAPAVNHALGNLLNFWEPLLWWSFWLQVSLDLGIVLH